MIIEQVRQLIDLVASKSRERQTLDELLRVIDRRAGREARQVFERIRQKTLLVEGGKDGVLEAQYLFEEVCAKTLYNLSRGSAPYDPDSPYWIVPGAFAVARKIGIDDSRILAIILGENR